LKEAGIVTDEGSLRTADLAILESLTSEEVDQLIALRDRLGVDFVQNYSRISAAFIF
jgi:hypothetical protein